jgi:hypothetical protein
MYLCLCRYMHLTCSPPVAHGNNILLDAQLMPYLCDSGLTKLRHFVSTMGTVSVLKFPSYQ